MDRLVMRGFVLLILLACACGLHRAPVGSSAAPLLPHEAAPVSSDAGAEGVIAGSVRRDDTRAPLGSAVVVLMSSSLPEPMEIMTDDYGRYRFDGLPPGTYTVQVLVGLANVSKVLTLSESAEFRANFALDPEAFAIICQLPVTRAMGDASLFSITNEAEARMLGVPRTIRRL